MARAAPATQDVIKDLWLGAGLPMTYLNNAKFNLPNSTYHVLPSSFRIGCAAQASITATALAASLYTTLIGDGDKVEANVDARHAALEFASERYSRICKSNREKSESVHASHDDFKKMLGLPLDMPADWDPLAGYYQCSQGRYIRLHTNWLHHKLGLLKILGLSADANRKEVADALLDWRAEEFERLAIEVGMCATVYRSSAEWNETEMAKSIQEFLDENNGCPVKVKKVDVAESTSRLPSATIKKPLRVIDMSRVIAAPVAARCLAKHGADVLLVSGPNLPHLPMLEIDTARGKRCTQVDLDQEEERVKLTRLVKDADVLLQAYRPGALAKRGFGLEELQMIRPGLIYAELSAYGFTGPWREVRGFDSLVQSASGINASEADSYRDYEASIDPSKADERSIGPRVLPCQALDHASGYLLAFGVLAAKCRSLLDKDTKSGWHIQVSLAGVASWLESLGRVHGKEAWQIPSPIDVEGKEVLDLLEPYSIRGAAEPLTLYAIQHAAQNLPGLDKQSVPARLDVDSPEWKVLQ